MMRGYGGSRSDEGVGQQAEGWMRSGERRGDDELAVLEVGGYERD